MNFRKLLPSRKNLIPSNRIRIRRNISRKAKVYFFSFLLPFLIYAILFGFDSFFDRFDLSFQTPVILQSPVNLQERKVEPVYLEKEASNEAKIKSFNLVSNVYAQVIEPTPTPIPTIIPTPKPTAKPVVKTGNYSVDYVVGRLTSRVTEIWGESHVQSMLNIVKNESGFNPYAINKSSGACGLPQALPCSKILNKCGTLDNVDCQIEWTLEYVTGHGYGTPNNAWSYWVSKRYW